VAEFGYAGKILKINLSNGQVLQEDTGPYAEKYLGGRGFAAKLFWDMVPPNTRALHPDNLFVAVTGPTTGFVGIAGCRFQVCGKTPGTQPEMFSYGNLGGKWGNQLKGAGFDAAAVQGRAKSPVYLYIHDGQVEVRDASQLWGQQTFDCMDSLREELGQAVSVLTVGPAGENQVIFATVMADEGASGSGGGR
jgi:aldehyde:ferredoxin oxidoreductase